MNKNILLASLAVAVIGAGVLTVSGVSAQESDVTGRVSIAQRIAQRFGLNQDEVQAFFDEEHEARHAEMEVRFEKRLSTLVSEGTITEEQKQLIIVKHDELEATREAERDTFQSMTVEERQAKREADRAEMEAWAEANGIDLSIVSFGGGKGGHVGRGGHGGMMRFEAAE